MKTESLGNPFPAPDGQLRDKLDALVLAVHRSWLGLVLALVATAVIWLGVGAAVRAAGGSEFWAMVVAGIFVSAISAWAARPYAAGCSYNVPLWTALAIIAPWFPFALPVGFVAVQIDLARHLRNFGVTYRLWQLDEAQVALARTKLTA